LIKTSTQEYIEQANAVSRLHCEWESKKMIKSPLSSSNRTEWNIMDIGVLQTGAQNAHTQQSLKMIMNTY
jgi:long-chain acyl-CoA synthetase